MALSDEDAALLAALRTAKARLLAGKAVAKVQYGSGQVVDYVPADMKALQAEIDRLVADGSTSGKRRGVIRFSVR